jgi:hypothetical protein
LTNKKIILRFAFLLAIVATPFLVTAQKTCGGIFQSDSTSFVSVGPGEKIVIDKTNSKSNGYCFLNNLVGTSQIHWKSDGVRIDSATGKLYDKYTPDFSQEHEFIKSTFRGEYYALYNSTSDSLILSFKPFVPMTGFSQVQDEEGFETWEWILVSTTETGGFILRTTLSELHSEDFTSTAWKKDFRLYRLITLLYVSP